MYLGLGLGIGFPGGASTPSGGTSPFTDDFNRANQNLDASANWTRVGGISGAVAVDTNRLRIADTTETSYLSPEIGDADHYAQATWLSADHAAGFLTVRHTDNSNFVGVRYHTSAPAPVGWHIYKRVAGTFTELAGVAQATPSGRVLRLEVSGDTVRLLEDDVEIIAPVSLSGSHAGITRSGVIGRSALANPWLDNFESGPL